MHLTVVILAGSNQLFLNSFLLHKNKELTNLTKRLSHPSKPPQQKRDKPRHKNILLSFFSKAEPHFGLSQKTHLFSKECQWKCTSLKDEIWWLDSYEEMILEMDGEMTKILLYECKGFFLFNKPNLSCI